MVPADHADTWRRRMRRLAERLRRIDAQLFENQIDAIEQCLHRDATWDLQAALTCGTRWQASPSPTTAAEHS